eukprot:scaffold15662_cov62-Phaeocystis_antarctica.AAC.4
MVGGTPELIQHHAEHVGGHLCVLHDQDLWGTEHLARRTNFGVRPLEGQEWQLHELLTIQYVNIIGGTKASSRCALLLDSPVAARRAARRGQIYYVMRFAFPQSPNNGMRRL